MHFEIDFDIDLKEIFFFLSFKVIKQVHFTLKLLFIPFSLIGDSQPCTTKLVIANYQTVSIKISN